MAPMKIGYLGIGAWGFCLASLLAKKGHSVISWSIDKELVKQLEQTREHPKLPGHRSSGEIAFTNDLQEALDGADFVVESVTSKGLRPVLEQVKELRCPLVLTSKGIEQGSGKILSEVVLDVLGEEMREKIGALSGPSFAHDVVRRLPTSVVSSGYNRGMMQAVSDLFTTDTFRVYPNPDIIGVSYGGALKNVIAIACGICEGLALGYSSNAALMTRGLHEVRKLALARGALPETLNGLSGMGDLCLTCSSLMSRNYQFGHLLAEGLSPERAKERVGMVVEGAYTCVSALELSRRLEIPMPITEAVYKILFEGLQPREAVSILMRRTIKEERL